MMLVEDSAQRHFPATLRIHAHRRQGILAMHSLSKIHIKNFRSCKQVFLPLGDFTPLVGQNNAGKSTVLDAIRLVLAPKAFAKTDANDPDLPIIISAVCVRPTPLPVPGAKGDGVHLI